MEEDFGRIPEFDLGALGGIMYISVIGKPSTQAAAASEGPSALTLATVRKDPTAILPSHSAWTCDSCPPVTVCRRGVSFLSAGFTGLRGIPRFLFFTATIQGTFSPGSLSGSNSKQKLCPDLT